ncbi:hypothetical protein ACLOJK_035821 [Asimina triloba]
MDERKQRGRRKVYYPEKGKKCGPFCCSCRLSVSSSEDNESTECDRVEPISSLVHAIVQEKLDQMVRGKLELGNGWRTKKPRMDECKCIIMVAVDKCSYDPRDDFRRSMFEVITTNKIEEPKVLRCLLNCYISMNSEECRPMILRTFHEISLTSV